MESGEQSHDCSISSSLYLQGEIEYQTQLRDWFLSHVAVARKKWLCTSTALSAHHRNLPLHQLSHHYQSAGTLSERGENIFTLRSSTETAFCDDQGGTYPLQMAHTREALVTISEPNRR
jgi:hypothetical protein